MTLTLTDKQCQQVRAVKAMMELHDAPHVTEEQALERALAIAADQAYGKCVHELGGRANADELFEKYGAAVD